MKASIHRPHRRFVLLTALAFGWTLAVGAACAADQRDWHDHGNDRGHGSYAASNGNHGDNHDFRGRRGAPPNYFHDQRYGHDRNYPNRGHAVRILPRRYITVRHGGVPYYFHGGVWYRHSGTRFVVIAPPIGIVIPFLPPYYTTIWVHGAPYYYADDTYYAWRPELSGYQVVEAPAESQVTVPQASEQETYIYPNKNQSQQQQATDRYQCYRWAVDQTGFDPTKPLGGVSDSEAATKRADYKRAEAACLEGRGYTVK